MTELKKCPFCGGEADLVHHAPFVHPVNGRQGSAHWNAECTRCGASTPMINGKQEAISAWNRRVNDA